MAWTITESLEAYKINHMMGSEMIVVKLVCTSDASGTDYDLTSIAQIKGGWLYEMKVVPSGAPDAPTGTFDIDIEDVDNAHILDTNANSQSAVTFHDGADTIGHYPLIQGKCSFVSATLANTKKATVYLSFLK